MTKILICGTGEESVRVAKAVNDALSRKSLTPCSVSVMDQKQAAEAFGDSLMGDFKELCPNAFQDLLDQGVIRQNKKKPNVKNEGRVPETGDKL